MSLTVVQAEEIRRLHAAGVRSREIGELVGLSIRTINDVLDGNRPGRALTPRERFDEDGRAGWAPLCMEPGEWTDWRARNPLTPDATAIARPCEECPLGFAADMRAQQLCNGTPGGVAEDPDETQEETTVEPARPDPGITVPVSLEAPCARCEKADACGLRASVENLVQLPVLIPVLDHRLGVELAGQVTCSAFVKARIRKADVDEVDRPKRQMSEEGRANIAAAARRRREREREGTAA